jgi:hypothetical protein
VNTADSSRADASEKNLQSLNTSSGSAKNTPKQSFRYITPRGEAKVDAEKARFPYCIVWTPLPLISWFLPCIGHTGIALSDGVIHDFSGPYQITVDDLAFGETHK